MPKFGMLNSCKTFHLIYTLNSKLFSNGRGAYLAHEAEKKPNLKNALFVKKLLEFVILKC